MSNLQRIVYLSETEFATLLSEGTITKNGRTLTYNQNDLYITPEIDTPTFEFVESTNTSSSAALTGAISVNTLENGKIILYHTKFALPAQDQTLEITFANSTTSTYPIYISDGVRCNISRSSGVFILLTYYNSAFYIVNPSNTTN